MARNHPALNSGDREQEVRTPSAVVARVAAAFGGSIALDPCSPTFSESTVRAERVIRDPRFEPGAIWNHAGDGRFRVAEPRRIITPGVLGVWLDDPHHDEVAPASMLDEKGPWRFVSSPAPSGLDVEWVDRTYVNPPFKTLEDWLAKARATMSADPAKRLAVLAPWRSNRRWFLETLAHDPRPIVTLEPGLAFEGFAVVFPAPVAILSWGCVIEPSPGGVVIPSFYHWTEIAP